MVGEEERDREIVRGLRRYYENAGLVLFREGAIGEGDIGLTRYYREVLAIYTFFRRIYSTTYEYILKKITYDDAITEIGKTQKNPRGRISEQVRLLVRALQKHEDMRYNKLIMGGIARG